MGVALGACTVPAAGRPGFALGEDEAELGLGIHGERGVTGVKLAPVDGFVEEMLTTILADAGLAAGARVALLINGLGGTPPMELAVAARHALTVLRGRGLVVERAWSGDFLTALEMPGLSLSVMAVDDARLARLDASTQAPAWPGGALIAPRQLVSSDALPETPQPPVSLSAPAAALREIVHQQRRQNRRRRRRLG